MGSEVDVSKVFVEIEIFKEDGKILAKSTFGNFFLWRRFNFGKNRNNE